MLDEQIKININEDNIDLSKILNNDEIDTKMDNVNKKIVGASLAGLFVGILVGYLLGINRTDSDNKFLSEWTKDVGNYEDGNIYGYETGLPDEYFSKPPKATKADKAQRSNLK